jgi:signal transduction histidine kinase
VLPRDAVQGVTIRRALFLGFGLMVALWAFTGYRFTRRIADGEQRLAALNRRYTRAQQLLATVRAQVLLGGVIVRDALLDPTPESVETYRRQLAETSRDIGRALTRYSPILEAPAERERVATLRAEIDDYGKTLSDLLATDTAHRSIEAPALLRTRLAPKRQMVMELSEQVQALNRATFVEQQTAVAAIYAATQRELWRTLSLALAASFGIGIIATMHAGRLSDRVSQQRAREVETTRELQRLSSRLITAQEEERRAIARELHDEVGQLLAALKAELSMSQRAIETQGLDAAGLASARALADGAIQTVRDLSHLLHPALLDDLGLPQAIDWYVRGFTRHHALRVDFTHTGMDERLAAAAEASVYRIVQEALTNVARHAHASACRVSLERQEASVLLAIEDDGVGFNPAALDAAAAADRGLGLIGIRERVAALHGSFTIDTARERGTSIMVAFPATARAGCSEEVHA